MSYINTQTHQYPVSEQDIRNFNPNTSFPTPFVAPDEYAVVFPAPQPTHDPIIQAVREIAPVLTDKGHYEQQWEVVPRFVEYTDEEGVTHTVAEQEAAAIEADRKSKVPQVISRRQAKQALLKAGLLDVADAAISASGDRAAQIDWVDAQEFRRDWATLISMQNALGLTDEQIDDLFRLAATL